VNLAVGSTVTSGSTTATIAVQGGGGYEVSTTVGVDQIPHVAVGDTASVTPDGSHTALQAKVASISIAPTSTTPTTYLVVLGLLDPNAKLSNGATGTTAITTQRAKRALAVPTSAVSTNGTRHTVRVFDGQSTHRVTVQVGVVGNTWTEIKSGVQKGEQVVLADVSRALPGSATSSASTSTSTNTNTPAGRLLLPGLNGGGTRGGVGGR
jgi:HlyD family secretion protein